MASISSREVIRRLEGAGFVRVRQRGSHVQMKHPTTGVLVTVPHPKRDLPLGTAKSIFKAAGIAWGVPE